MHQQNNYPPRKPPSDLDIGLGDRTEDAEYLAALDRVDPAAWGEFGAAGAMRPAPFATAIENFYMTDPISRASATMADCTAARAADGEGATGTDG